MIGKGAWGTMTLMAVGVAGYALVSALVPDLRAPFVQDLFSAKALRAFGHLAAGGIALATGAIQFSTRLRLTRPKTHRLLGRVYLATVTVSGVAAVLMAPTSSGGVPAHWGFGMLGVLWVTSAVVAVLRVRAGDYVAHREWMIRSYALCLAAVTLRIYLPLSIVAQIPFEQSYPAIAWLCWVPNLVVAEWFLVRGPVVPIEA